MTSKSLVIGLTVMFQAVFGLNGFFPVGYGTPSKGMGGVGIALPQDSLAGAMNPAGLAFLCNRVDLGFGWAGWDGSLERSQSFQEGFNRRLGSDESAWYPELGINYHWNPCLSLGLAYYLNGLFDVDYGKSFAPYGTTALSASYRQYALLPSVAWSPDECHSVGLSLLISRGTLHFNGLQALVADSESPANVTNRGDDTRWGFGFRIGWLGTLFNIVGLGATFQTPVWTPKFSRYRGLVPDGGNFDTPARAGGGVAICPFDYFVAAFDFEYLFYRNVDGFDHNALSMNPRGSANGPGLGWDGIWVIKLGAAYNPLDCLTLRIGYNYGSSPIDSDAVYINALTLATVEHHFTLGATYRVGCSDFSFAYNHGFCNRVSGRLEEGRQVLKNNQDHVTLSYGRVF